MAIRSDETDPKGREGGRSPPHSASLASRELFAGRLRGHYREGEREERERKDEEGDGGP
jgi:hypothetical protein